MYAWPADNVIATVSCSRVKTRCKVMHDISADLSTISTEPRRGARRLRFIVVRERRGHQEGADACHAEESTSGRRFRPVRVAAVVHELLRVGKASVSSSIESCRLECCTLFSEILIGISIASSDLFPRRLRAVRTQPP